MAEYLYTARPSSSGTTLAKSLGIKKIKRQGSRFKPRHFHTVINWGNSELPNQWTDLCTIVNDPDFITICTDKLRFFEWCMDKNTHGNKDLPRIPKWTSSKETAELWLQEDECEKIVTRKILTGHSGNGIIISGKGQRLENAPLYVQYIKKKQEYRLHFFKGKEDDPFIQRKVRVRDHNSPNWLVRNLLGGFVYANDPNNVGSVPSDVIEQARRAFNITGLHFCAVDVIWNSHYEKAYVLEVNTAPGLEGRTLEYYKNAMTNLLQQQG